MNLRPAGMSDEEEEEDDYYYSDTHGYPSDEYLPGKRSNNRFDDEILHENQLIESNIVSACLRGDLATIEAYLIDHDVNAFVYTGWTLLLYATSSVQLDVIEFLLVCGADPNKHKDGFTPLMALCASNKDLPKVALHCLILLIEAKADVNATTKQRETALMFACKSQNIEFVNELLKHVTNIDARDSSGKTALICAVGCNRADIVKSLLERNANTTLANMHFLTAQDIANIKGYTEISALLTDKDEEQITYCNVSQILTWRDLFPELNLRNKELLDHNIWNMLRGMGLEKYDFLFRGMDFKTFLQLTEDDLCRLGIDLTVYRDQFLENLHKFHCKRWHVDSIGIIKKSAPYSIYDGVLSLANIKQQIIVIASSFQYMKNNLMKSATENIYFDTMEKAKYEEQLKKTQTALKKLKDEIKHFSNFAREIDRRNGIGTPANFLTSPKKRVVNKTRWFISLGVTLIVGLYIYKTTCIRKL